MVFGNNNLVIQFLFIRSSAFGLMYLSHKYAKSLNERFTRIELIVDGHWVILSSERNSSVSNLPKLTEEAKKAGAAFRIRNVYIVGRHLVEVGQVNS